MNSHTIILIAAIVSLLTVSSFADVRQDCERAIEKKMRDIDKGIARGPYKADWESLKKHDANPEWFRDAKFGIYFHWGVYSVPAYYNEWYARAMHRKTRRVCYPHHVKTYGEPDKFGYHDFIPMFKAEHFDAENWAELFLKAGAKYAGPVCEHHDGYSMWDSNITPWNAADTGPKRDITGELEKAIRKRGMKFITTFHHERTRNWYPRVKGWPTTTDDPKLQLLYMNIPEQLFNNIFQTKLAEVIDKYHPDLIWFDCAMQQILEPTHLRFLAYYLNAAKAENRKVVITTKKRQYPEEISVMDYEKGRAQSLTKFCWLTDDTISMGSWCYTRGLKIKPTSRVLHDLIDTVSKNGCMLLNISPKSDGTIPEVQRKVLLGIGAWLKVAGEAIYDTRPWLIHGEGPIKITQGGSFSGHQIYNAKDIRYTRSKDSSTVYVIPLGWPEANTLTPESIRVDDASGGKIELLGCDKPVKFSVGDGKRLTINLPDIPAGKRPCEHAFALKLTGFKLGLNKTK